MEKGAVGSVKHPARPAHGVLQKAGVKPPLRLLEMPRWHGWTSGEEWRRLVRWMESVLTLPVGQGAGELMRVPPFQRAQLKTICESIATFISIPAGNGKTTFMAALGLATMCSGADYVEVDVLATKEEQAERLVTIATRMVECSPQLHELFAFYARDSVLEYRPTGSTMRPHPAKLSAVQGLNGSLTLVDEVGDVPAELVSTMLARIGKRPDQHVVGFGTPGTSAHENMLEEIRRMSREDELPLGASFIEYAAEDGCAVNDPAQWAKANPAIEAGFLSADSLPLKMGIMSEHLFRAWHLGQPVAGSGPWLPFGAWDACPFAAAPADGAEVVLCLWGSYRRQAALVGCTLAGEVFFGWQAEKPSDGELEAAVLRAAEQWRLVELVHQPHIRLALLRGLEELGLPVVAWPADRATDVESTAALFKAIADQELAHDHDEWLGGQVARLTAKVDGQGMPRLVELSDDDVSAALAARAAWWVARRIAEEPAGEMLIW
jgi:hypothetical protein